LHRTRRRKDAKDAKKKKRADYFRSAKLCGFWSRVYPLLGFSFNHRPSTVHYRSQVNRRTTEQRETRDTSCSMKLSREREIKRIARSRLMNGKSADDFRIIRVLSRARDANAMFIDPRSRRDTRSMCDRKRHEPEDCSPD